jgi:hypothetical protein
MGNHTATFTRNYFNSKIDGGIIMNMNDIKQLMKEVGWGDLGNSFISVIDKKRSW